jgi:hypothetical protein
MRDSIFCVFFSYLYSFPFSITKLFLKKNLKYAFIESAFVQYAIKGLLPQVQQMCNLKPPCKREKTRLAFYDNKYFYKIYFAE